MRNPLADRVVEIKPSGIRKFFDIVSEMKDAISLGVGEPDFDTPWHIREEGIYSLEKGRTSYTSNAGMKELKQEICNYINRKQGVTYNAVNEVLVTVGGSEAIDEKTVIERDQKVAALLLHLNLVIGRSERRNSRNLEHTAIKIKLYVRTDASRHLFLGDKSRSFQSRNHSLTVNRCKNTVRIENDTVKINVLSLNETGEENDLSNMEHDIFAGQIDAYGLSLVILEELEQFSHGFCGDDEGEAQVAAVLVLIFDIRLCQALCKLVAIAGHCQHLVSRNTEIASV